MRSMLGRSKAGGCRPRPVVDEARGVAAVAVQEALGVRPSVGARSHGGLGTRERHTWS